MSYIELIAVLFGVACVYLTIRQNIWCWPTGLVQVSLYIFIFYNARLYSDVILHIIYVFLQFYGWYHWVKGGNEKHNLPVSTLPTKRRIGWAAAAILGTIAWGYSMSSLTDASIPYGDAFTTVASLIAQWLLARKKLESWIFWILVDVVALGIYWYKELYLTSGLYAMFLVLAIAGFIAWRASLRNENGNEK